MRRREFIKLLGGAAAWPLVSHGQQRIPVVGLLSGVSFEDRIYALFVEQIRQGLKNVGFVEGQNMLIEYRSADSHPERVQDLANDLVRRQVAVIVAIGGSNVALVAKATTSTVPIVFAVGGDALENGLVKNFNKPEANVTGMSFNNRQLATKRLGFLRALLPKATLFGYLDNVATASEIATGIELVVFYAGTAHEIDSAFETMVQQHVEAVIVSSDAYLVTRYDQIISLAKLHALPAIYPSASILRGGLMYYVFDVAIYRRAGIHAGRILKGTNVADLPVEMPTKFSLGINLNTAKALGLTIPPHLLALADEVIE
jgi:putative ABC transport system substrate-binding protein